MQQHQTVRYAVTGACGGFARTLLAQTRYLPDLAATALCDLDADGALAVCAELGLPEPRLCRTAEEVRAAGDRPVLVTDAALLADAEWDILVEATGNPAAGYAVAVAALTAGRHVAMASKEVDAVAGTQLAALAARHGAVYTPAGGDQPANLLGLYRWGRRIGLDIVAVGKSSEYDLVFNPATGQVTHQDRVLDAPELAGLLTLSADVPATLAARAAAVAELPRSASADYCEMAVVATGTGLVPDVADLHYPVARIAELADVYALREHGGLLHRPGAVDVFRALRLPGEASFAGGVFLVVRTGDAVTWDLLRGKGHLVSRDGRYACVYLPYHLMGVETPDTLYAAVREHRAATDTPPRQYAVLAGRAARDLPAGTRLTLYGHHHDIDGLDPLLLPYADTEPDTAPFYLAANARTAVPVPAGTVLRLDHLAGADPVLADAWRHRVLPEVGH